MKERVLFARPIVAGRLHTRRGRAIGRASKEKTNEWDKSMKDKGTHDYKLR
jgi:hypothetical protein